MENIYRGDVYMVDLETGKGSEQNGVRPAVVLQNNIGNKYSKTVIIACITTKYKKILPTHIILKNNELKENSRVLLEQVRTVDKSRLINHICKLNEDELVNIDKALMVSVGLNPTYL